jgi:hypothetical protein
MCTCAMRLRLRLKVSYNKNTWLPRGAKKNGGVYYCGSGPNERRRQCYVLNDLEEYKRSLFPFEMAVEEQSDITPLTRRETTAAFAAYQLQVNKEVSEVKAVIAAAAIEA